MSIDSLQAQNCTAKSWVPFVQCPPPLTSCLTTVPCQNQGTDIDTIHRAYPNFTGHPCVPSCVCVALCGHNHQDTSLYHHKAFSCSPVKPHASIPNPWQLLLCPPSLWLYYFTNVIEIESVFNLLLLAFFLTPVSKTSLRFFQAAAWINDLFLFVA